MSEGFHHYFFFDDSGDGFNLSDRKKREDGKFLLMSGVLRNGKAINIGSSRGPDVVGDAY